MYAEYSLCALKNPTGRAASRQPRQKTIHNPNIHQLTKHKTGTTNTYPPSLYLYRHKPQQQTNIIGGSETNNNSAKRAPIPINTGVLN